jgi:hypothetical protein
VITGSEASGEAILETLRPLTYAILDFGDPVEAGKPVAPRSVDTGYTSVAMNAKEKSVVLYWRGPVPTEVHEIIDRFPDVPIDVHEDAEYSLTEMNVAMDAVQGWSVDAGYPLVRIGPDVEGDGIRVLAKVTESERQRGLSDSDATFALGESLGNETELPVQVTIAKPEDLSVATQSRQDDLAPWRGGAFYSTAGGSCSTGVGVRMNQTGNQYLLTAAHCAYWPAPNKPVTGIAKTPDDEQIGTWNTNNAAFIEPDFDSMLINPAGGSVSQKIYTDGTAFTETANAIVGVRGNALGETVCTSGGRSGAHCNIRTDSVGEREIVSKTVGTTDYVYYVSGMSSGVTDAGTITVASGDSGGPVYKKMADGTYRMMGIIESSSGYVACPQNSVVNPAAGGCASRVFWVSMTQLLSVWDAQLR